MRKKFIANQEKRIVIGEVLIHSLVTKLLSVESNCQASTLSREIISNMSSNDKRSCCQWPSKKANITDRIGLLNLSAKSFVNDSNRELH